MARKEINIFGTSFLDLLCGALAAVIILFVIVPKQSQSPPEQTVPEEEPCDQTIAQLQQQNDLQAQEIEQLQQKVRSLERQLAESQQRRGVSSGKIFGIDAELGIVCQWRENVDVDLFVLNVATRKVCYYRNNNTDFGNMSEDIRGHTSDDGRYELFYQKKIVPGTYEVYVMIYSSDENPWNGTPANIEGFIVMHPGKQNQKLINYPKQCVSSTQRVVIGRLTVTNNSITLN